MVIEGLAPAGSEACSTAWMSLEKPAPAGQRAVAAAPRRRKERTSNREGPGVKAPGASSCCSRCRRAAAGAAAGSVLQRGLRLAQLDDRRVGRVLEGLVVARVALHLDVQDLLLDALGRQLRGSERALGQHRHAGGVDVGK